MTAALLQAGGQSSRMRHGGGPEHKALVTVHGRTMLQWNLDALLSAGVTAIFLAVNKGETGLLRYIRELAIPYVRRNGATVVELVEDEPLGTIGSARRCACEDALLVVNVDNLSVLPLDMLAAYKKDGKAPPKWHQTPTKLYLPDTAAAEYERRKDLY